MRPRTFGCVAMGSALLFIVRSRLLVYSAGSGVNRVQVVLSGFSKRVFLFCPGKNLVYVMVVLYFLAALVLVSFGCDCDVVCIGYDLKPVHWVVVSVRCKMLNSVGERDVTFVERQFLIDVVWMCDFNMLCRLCVPLM